MTTPTEEQIVALAKEHGILLTDMCGFDRQKVLNFAHTLLAQQKAEPAVPTLEGRPIDLATASILLQGLYYLDCFADAPHWRRDIANIEATLCRPKEPDSVSTYLNASALADAYRGGGETALRLVAQLIGAAPCEKCGYVKQHCRCDKQEPADHRLDVSRLISSGPNAGRVRKVSSPADHIADRRNPPFSNCTYKICDLPGQCRDEGKCHHPTDQRSDEQEFEARFGTEPKFSHYPNWNPPPESGAHERWQINRELFISGCQSARQRSDGDARDAERWRMYVETGFPKAVSGSYSSSASIASWVQRIGGVLIHFNSANEAIDAAIKGEKK